ncbi:hypothetical protein ACD905_15625 [Escherichia coli]
MAAKKPDIKLQPTVNVGTMDALQTGCVHITQYDEISEKPPRTLAQCGWGGKAEKPEGL